MSTSATTSPALVTMPVRDFMSNNNFVSVNKTVRTNTNGYAFVTFIDKDNKAENVYFSKASSIDHANGEVIEKGFFGKLQIAETTNAEGEKRMKLVTLGGSRLTVEDLF